MISIKTKPKTIDIAFLFVLFYLSILNIVVFKMTPELLFLQFILLIIFFYRFRAKEFIKYWAPFIALFFLYEFLRGFVDDFSPFYNQTLLVVYGAENALFNPIPTVFLQEIFKNNLYILYFSTFFYTLFFYYSFLTAFIVWFYKKHLFKLYSIGFLLLTFTGLMLFFLFPTAPPWMLGELNGPEITRLLFENNTVNHFAGVSVWNYFINSNHVAALPSLHVAWPMFTSLFIVIYFKHKIKYLFLLIPLFIGFSIIYAGEHYLIDVLFGLLLAVFSLYVAIYLVKKFTP